MRIHFLPPTLLLLCCLIYSVSGYCSQGSEWIEYNGRCYYWSKTGANWFNAELTCRKSGGHLASIGSQNENSFLLRLTQCRHYFWIGMVNTVHSWKNQMKGYEWWDGRQHAFTKLAANTNNYHDCVVSANTERWTNTVCQGSYTFVCMAPARTSDQPQLAEKLQTGQPSVANQLVVNNSTISQKPARCPTGWKLLDDNCYLISESRTNYFNAQMMCQSKSASVVSVLTPREQILLTLELGCNAQAWIGLEKARPCFKEPSKSFCWVWMDKKPVSHTDWASGHGSDNRALECVILDGQWKMVNCYSEYRYICKRAAARVEEKFAGLNKN